MQQTFHVKGIQKSALNPRAPNPWAPRAAQEGFEDLIANDEEVEAAAEENQQLYQRREAELQRRDNEMSDEQLEEFVRKRFENRSYEVRALGRALSPALALTASK